MKTLYLDLISGISGDMFLGALLDLGVELPTLEAGLARLRLEGFHLHVSRQQRGAIAGAKFDVHLEGGADHAHPHPPAHAHHHAHSHPHHHAEPHDEHEGHDAHSQGEVPADTSHEPGPSRSFADIRALLAASDLSPWVKEKSVAVFQRLAVAEGKVHGLPPEQVHFHEVGALDSIVDVVGACLALEGLGQPRVLASPVVEGAGWTLCAHGRFPIPAPATLEVLAARGVAITQCDEPHELVTPTGAALLAEFAEGFGPLEGLAVQRVGYGLGARELRSRPNVLRVLLGEAPAPSDAPAWDWETDTVAVLETNLDDANPELLGHFVAQALAAGALDVFHTPVQMKKNRPGVVLTVLCPPADADQFTAQMLRETSAFGVRCTLAERRKLRRELRTVPTPYGEITLKLGTLNGRLAQAAPEFESCRQAAARAGVPLKRVYEAALQAFHAHD